MTHDEQMNLVMALRDLADFYEREEALVLPTPYFNDWEQVRISEWNSDTQEYEEDLDKAKEKFKSIVKSLGSCEKNWVGDELDVTKRFGDYIKLNFSLAREAVCKKVPTGEKRIIPARPAREATPEREEDVYEWVCEDKSLLA